MNFYQNPKILSYIFLTTTNLQNCLGDSIPAAKGDCNIATATKHIHTCNKVYSNMFISYANQWHTPWNLLYTNRSNESERERKSFWKMVKRLHNRRFVLKLLKFDKKFHKLRVFFFWIFILSESSNSSKIRALYLNNVEGLKTPFVYTTRWAVRINSTRIIGFYVSYDRNE